jgi:hypothetical protein
VYLVAQDGKPRRYSRYINSADSASGPRATDAPSSEPGTFAASAQPHDLAALYGCDTAPGATTAAIPSCISHSLPALSSLCCLSACMASRESNRRAWPYSYLPVASPTCSYCGRCRFQAADLCCCSRTGCMGMLLLRGFPCTRVFGSEISSSEPAAAAVPNLHADPCSSRPASHAL